MASEYVALGAIVGSIIAALFRRSARWLFQLFVGSWVGWLVGIWLNDVMGWPPESIDYSLLAGTIAGCVAFSLVEAILSTEGRQMIKNKVLAVLGGNK